MTFHRRTNTRHTLRDRRVRKATITAITLTLLLGLRLESSASTLTVATKSTLKAKLTTGLVADRLNIACNTLRSYSFPGLQPNASVYARTYALEQIVRAFTEYAAAVKLINPVNAVEAGSIKLLVNYASFSKTELSTVLRLYRNTKTRQASQERYDQFTITASNLSTNALLDLLSAGLPICLDLIVYSGPSYEPSRIQPQPTTPTTALGASRIEVPDWFFPSLPGFTFNKTAGYDLDANLLSARGRTSYQAISVRQVADSNGKDIGVISAFQLSPSVSQEEGNPLLENSTRGTAGLREIDPVNNFRIFVGLRGGRDIAVYSRGEIRIEVSFVLGPDRGAFLNFATQFLSQFPTL
jgi:hypothetical protein